MIKSERAANQAGYFADPLLRVVLPSIPDRAPVSVSTRRSIDGQAPWSYPLCLQFPVFFSLPAGVQTPDVVSLSVRSTVDARPVSHAGARPTFSARTEQNHRDGLIRSGVASSSGFSWPAEYSGPRTLPDNRYRAYGGYRRGLSVTAPVRVPRVSQTALRDRDAAILGYTQPSIQARRVQRRGDGMCPPPLHWFEILVRSLSHLKNLISNNNSTTITGQDRYFRCYGVEILGLVVSGLKYREQIAWTNSSRIARDVPCFITSRRMRTGRAFDSHVVFSVVESSDICSILMLHYETSQWGQSGDVRADSADGFVLNWNSIQTLILHNHFRFGVSGPAIDGYHNSLLFWIVFHIVHDYNLPKAVRFSQQENANFSKNSLRQHARHQQSTWRMAHGVNGRYTSRYALCAVRGRDQYGQRVGTTMTAKAIDAIQIKLIHIARAQLGLSEDCYRDVL